MRILTAALACAVVTAVPASAQDATGTWSASFNTPNGPRPATLNIKKAGEKLTGSISGEQGETPIEGTQKGADVTIAFVVQTGNGPFNIGLAGKQEGDSLTGMADYNGVGQGDWSAERTGGAPSGGSAPATDEKQALDVSGAWALQVETGAGSGAPTVTFKQDGDKLSGTYVGQFGESAVSGTIKGSEISFSTDVSVEGNTVRIVYTGTVEKDAMKGTVAFGDLAQGTFTGKRK